MTYTEYQNIVRKINKPTSEQTANFIEFVSKDHSWYKHLTDKREMIFVFYLNPDVGKTLQSVKKKWFIFETEHFYFDETKFNDYQAKFGHWDYFTAGIFFWPHKNLFIVNEQGARQSIPEEVLKMGQFLMSRYLYKMFASELNYADSDGISYAEKHKIIINDLKNHLHLIADTIHGH